MKYLQVCMAGSVLFDRAALSFASRVAFLVCAVAAACRDLGLMYRLTVCNMHKYRAHKQSQALTG